MSISHINGIAVSAVSHRNGVAKANISAINGVTSGFGGLGLLTNLISYWKLDESSGNALDAHGGNALTDTNTVGAGTGKINGARSFSGTNYFTRADNADMSVSGNVSFTFSCWVNLDTKTSQQTVWSKWANSGNQRGYLLDYSNSTDRFRFSLSSNGTTATIVSANNLGAVSTGTWYHIVAWHDEAADTINICVNDGTPDSAAHSTGSFDNTAAFEIGRRSADGNLLDGLVDEVGFWKGRVLSATDRTNLYNSGNGLAYGSF